MLTKGLHIQGTWKYVRLEMIDEGIYVYEVNLMQILNQHAGPVNFCVERGCSCYCPPIAEWFHITGTLCRSAFVQGQVRWAARVSSCSHFQHANCPHHLYHQHLMRAMV